MLSSTIGIVGIRIGLNVLDPDPVGGGEFDFANLQGFKPPADTTPPPENESSAALLLLDIEISVIIVIAQKYFWVTVA